MLLPKRVTIELTNRCNRLCIGCPRHKMNYPLGDMNLTLFTKITSQLPDNVCIVPFYRGESTLHPHFSEYMQQLSRFDTVQLATNGDYLTIPNQKAILDNCTFLSLSLHEFKYPNQTSWLPLLYDCLGIGIETQVSILDTLLPEHKRKGFVRAWQKHVDRVRIYKEHSKNGFGSLNLKSTGQTCNKPFEDLIVYWNGKVGLCNHDWNNSVLLGDLNIQSISNVWNDEPYREMRRLHVNGERRLVATCRDCDFQSNQIYGEIIKNAR